MKKIFINKDEETRYYDTLDYPKYLGGLKPIKLDDSIVIPTSQSISIRLPLKLLQKVKYKANSMDVPYQNLIKTYIQKGVSSK